MANLKQHAGWFASVVAVVIISTVVVFAPWAPARADAAAAPGAPPPPTAPQFQGDLVLLAQVPGGRQIFRDDLTVEGGQTLEGDVAVYSGNVTVEGGGRIDGNLVVYSGDIEIESGGVIEGDVTAFSGNIDVAGSVGGDLASWSGNVDLDTGARVEGDVSVLSGRIEREEGVFVGGNLVEGPSFRLPGAPSSVRPPAAPVLVDRQTGFFGWLGQLILRLIGAALLTALVTLLAGVIAYARPELVTRVRQSMRQNLALSFVVGLLLNLTLLFLSGLLAVTICLLPVALVPILLLLGLNLIGWTAVAQYAGERISTVVKQPVQPPVAVIAGTVVLTGLVALLWALGGCFWFVGLLLLLSVSSFGTGAVVVPWLNRRREDGSEPGGGGGVGVPPTGPSRGPSTPPSAAPDVPPTVDTDVAAPVDHVTAEDVLANERAAQAGTAAERTPAAGALAETRREEKAREDTVDRDVAAPMDYVTAEDILAGEEAARQGTLPRSQTTPEHHGPEQPGAKPAPEEEDLDVGAPLDYLTAEEVNAHEARAERAWQREDDFTVIKGIGPVFDRRLKEAGIRTFGQLAASSPAQIAEIIGWPVDRVQRSDFPGQARHFATQTD